MNIQKIHHVAYRCKDAKETVEWYVKHHSTVSLASLQR